MVIEVTERDIHAALLAHEVLQPEVGPVGPPGPEGPEGPAGADGANGAPGPIGPEGLEGARGPQGWLGPIGPEGPQGPQGERGLKGERGPAGTPGRHSAGGGMGGGGGFASGGDKILIQSGGVPVGSVTAVDFEGATVVINGQVATISGFGGGGGGSDAFFHFNQGTPATVWSIAHNLGKFPAVSVVDSGGGLKYGDVQYVDLNHVQITFSAGFSGDAYLN